MSGAEGRIPGRQWAVPLLMAIGGAWLLAYGLWLLLREVLR